MQIAAIDHSVYYIRPPQNGIASYAYEEASYLIQSLHSPLPPVLQPAGQPLLPPVDTLLAERLPQRKTKTMSQSNQGRTVGSRDKNCHLCQVRIFSFQITIQPPLQLTRRIASSSSPPVYLKGMRWRSMSEKYSFASFPVLVPRPL